MVMIIIIHNNNYNDNKKIIIIMYEQKQQSPFEFSQSIMHQSFVAPAPSGPRNSGAFNFSIFKALLKALHCRAKFLVKTPLKAPDPRGLTKLK